jgi:hypothetical protein
MTKPTDQTRAHVIATYVKPARLKGESLVQVRVGTVQKELGWTNRTPSVFSTLSSREFQQEAGVELIDKKGGPPSGGPSTTVQFVYRLLDEEGQRKQRQSVAKPSPNGAGLEKLFGVFKDVYRELGGGEAYLKAERNWGPDAWQKYEQRQGARKGNRK